MDTSTKPEGALETTGTPSGMEACLARSTSVRGECASLWPRARKLGGGFESVFCRLLGGSCSRRPEAFLEAGPCIGKAGGARRPGYVTVLPVRIEGHVEEYTCLAFTEGLGGGGWNMHAVYQEQHLYHRPGQREEQPTVFADLAHCDRFIMAGACPPSAWRASLKLATAAAASRPPIQVCRLARGAVQSAARVGERL